MERRLSQITAKRRQAEDDARVARAERDYWHAAATAILEAIRIDPDLHEIAALAGWCAALSTVPVVSDTPLKLSAAAARLLLADVGSGPAVVAALASDAALAKHIAELDPAAQALELGKLAAAVSPSSARPEVPSIFSLFNGSASK